MKIIIKGSRKEITDTEEGGSHENLQKNKFKKLITYCNTTMAFSNKFSNPYS